MRSIELFAGAGGLAIGMSNAGFHHSAVIEWDHDACETFRENQKHHSPSVETWPLHEGDVRDFEFKALAGNIDVVSGGPPCQPFSLGGKHRGSNDVRDMFPEAVRVVREVMPRAFIFENVKGLLRASFANYFEYIYLQLSYPSVRRRSVEKWESHRSRLEKHHTVSGRVAEYRVVFRLLNAADYGVPQSRFRVFIVGFRNDLGMGWSFPEPTHSQDSLLRAQWLTGEYWEEHKIAKRSRPALTARDAARVDRLRTVELFDRRLRWRTVRDAISDLPRPTLRPSNVFANHQLWPGARSYPGHTGSVLDAPAKTLKAGDHGVPGGENMLVGPNGHLRYFSIREAARLQTFPDDFIFRGSWSEAMRQLGNAVPVKLGEIIASSVASSLRYVEMASQIR